jgi:hypothetical protein
MPRGPDVDVLTRLLDAAVRLPRAEREAWVRALPAEHQALVPQLLGMLVHGVAPGDSLADLPPPPPRPAVPVAAPAPARPAQELRDPVEASGGELVGPFRLVHESARNSMAAVWLAERADGGLDRQVVLKLLRLPRSPRLAERMARERQTAALIEHPNIARLFDAGVDAKGRAYLATEHVRGVHLLLHAQRRRMGVAGRLELMLQACAAVAHGHRLLVLHREIEPTRLVVDDEGRVVVQDFGVARLFEPDDAVATNAREQPLRRYTSPYAAPEQRSGEPVSTSTDIYALGAVLHELLTGALPGAAREPDLDPYPVAATLVPMSPDLEAVLQRALHPDPDQRYTSVERLADDLQRVLDWRPVRAAPARLGHRLRLFARRRRIALATLAVVALVAGGLAAASAWRQARHRAQHQRLEQAREFLAALPLAVEAAPGQVMGQVTVAQMLQAALLRTRQGFAGEPVLRGQVLAELGTMWRHIGQPEQALQVLREAHELLKATAAVGDPALHLGQALLAQALMQEGSAAAAVEARTLATQALAGCDRAGAPCARVRSLAQQSLGAAEAH